MFVRIFFYVEGLFCHVRIKSKRAQKYKNIKAKYYNFANKNYNGINNDIYATDVTYIPVLIDVPDNHIFMSVIIHHQKNVALKMLTRLLRRYIPKGKSIDKYVGQELKPIADFINSHPRIYKGVLGFKCAKQMQ